MKKKKIGIAELEKERGISSTTPWAKFNDLCMRFGNFAGKRPFTTFLILFLLAFLPRVICWLQMQGSIISNIFPLDMAEYDRRAVEIAKGDIIGSGVLYAMPLYSYFLGGIYFLFGHDAGVARFIQLSLGAFNCAFLFFVSKHFFKDARIALVSFVIAFFFKLSVFYELMLDSATIATTFFLFLVYLVAKISDKMTFPRALLMGIISSLALLVRANFLILIPIIAVWLIVSFSTPAMAKRIVISAIFLLPVIAAVSVVAARNYYVGRDFVPLTAHGGINFYLGNGEYANGRYPNAPFLVGGSENMIKQSVVIAGRELNRQLRPSEASSYWFKRAMIFIDANPKEYLSLLIRKIKLFISGFEMPDVFSYSFSYKYIPALRIFFITFLFLLPLGISGIFLTLFRQKKAVILAILFFGYAAGIITFLVNERYKLPLYPLLAIFSASGLVCLFGERDHTAVKISGSILFLLMFLPFADTGFIKENTANQAASYNTIGYGLLERGEAEKAIECFSEAVHLAPHRADAHNSLGLGYLTIKDFDNAKREFEKAIELNPNFFQAYYNLASLYFEEGDTAKGNMYLEKYKAVSPYE